MPWIKLPCEKCGKVRKTHYTAQKPPPSLCRKCSARKNGFCCRPKLSREIKSQHRREEDRTRYHLLKKEILEHYGGTPPICKRCGIDDIDVLCIDHINGGGRKHHQELYQKHTTIYKWIKQHNFPEDYQILCANCNLKKEQETRRAKWLQ